MDIFRLVESYQMDLKKFETKQKISKKLKQKIDFFIKQNNYKQKLVLIETFGSHGYYAYILVKQ